MRRTSEVPRNNNPLYIGGVHAPVIVFYGTAFLCCSIEFLVYWAENEEVSGMKGISPSPAEARFQLDDKQAKTPLAEPARSITRHGNLHRNPPCDI
jgi:hypothetical protein